MLKPITWVFLTLVLTIFATIMLLAGVFSPLWIYLTTGSSITVAIGLVYRTDDGCTRDDNDNCVNAGGRFDDVMYGSDSTYDATHWSVVAGFEIGGAAMGVILIAMLVVYASFFSSNKNLNFFNTMLMIASIVTWLPVGLGLIIFALYHGDAFTNRRSLHDESFPWSALLSFIAAILFVFVTILIRSCCRKESYITHGVPASVDSKMRLYPSTENGLSNHYFAPSAYREDHFQGLSSVLDQDAMMGSQGNEVSAGMMAAPTSPYNRRRERNEVVVSGSPLADYHNRAFQTDQADHYNVVGNDQRRLTTEVVLGRSGAGQDVDLDNEGKEIVIYKGKDNVRRINDVVGLDVSNVRQGYLGPQTDVRMPQQNEFLFSAQHYTDKDAHRGGQNMVHTNKPSEDSPVNKRMVLSSSNFTAGNVKYNPTYAYRPYSEQVY